jgi:RNA polymerase sigma factor (sigma-70 family)
MRTLAERSAADPQCPDAPAQAPCRARYAREIERLIGPLYGVALRLTRDHHDAEDLVAETIAKAWARLAELRDPLRFEPWVRRILTNTFISRWRHRRALPEIAAEGADDDGEEPAFSLYERLHQPFLLWWSTPEDEVITALLRKDMDRAIDALPDVYRIVVVLVDVEGYSYAEAAGSLRVPVGTVRSRLARARSELQRALWRHAQDAGLVGAPQQGDRSRE